MSESSAPDSGRRGVASARARAMPESIFARMDAAKSAARAAGHEVIDLSIGSSDLPPPPTALEALREATRDPETYGYCLHSGTVELREGVAAWYRERYGREVDPEREVLPLIGAQEGFANLLLAITDPGDAILVTEPCYPSYFGAMALAGLERVPLPLGPHNDFLPDLEAIPAATAARARALVLNYPNNPTAAVAPAAFFEAAADFCRRHDLVLIHDFPYVDMVFGDYEAPSALTAGMDVGIELYSCSKSFHMGGFRIGWAIGDAEIVAALARVKGAVDFNQYRGIQRAALAALGRPRARTRADAAVYETRRDALLAALRKAGWEAPRPVASMYLWAPLPPAIADSTAWCLGLARATGVALAPGASFGASGEGWVRFALVREPEALERAVARIADYLD